MSTRRKHHKNELVDASLALNIELPSEMTPSSPLEGSSGVSQFYMLNATVTDTPTGVLMLGSFSASSFNDLQSSLLIGLKNLKKKGAEQLIVDVVCARPHCRCCWIDRLYLDRPTMAEVSVAPLAPKADTE